MNTLAVVLGVIDVIICIALIGLVISQEGNAQGLGSIAGGADTFFGSHKGSSVDNLLKKLTTTLAIIFAVLTVVLFLLTSK